MRELKFICCQPDDEIWKPIVGYETFYEISNFGRVKSLPRRAYYRNDPSKSYNKKEKILLLSSNHGSDYRVVKLYNGLAVGKMWAIHRLVAIHFLVNYHNLKMVNHIDGNPFNNRVENLEWCTHAYNVKHAYETGLKDPKNYQGSGNKTSKLVEDQVISMRNEYATGKTSYPKLARKYNIGASNVHSIIKRNTWRHV